jgi:hypothetical protein
LIEFSAASAKSALASSAPVETSAATQNLLLADNNRAADDSTPRCH